MPNAVVYIKQIHRCQQHGQYLLYYVYCSDQQFRCYEFKTEDRTSLKVGDHISNLAEHEVDPYKFWSRSLENTYRKTTEFKKRRKHPDYINKGV